MGEDENIVQFQMIRGALDGAEEMPPTVPPDHGGGSPLPPEPDGRLPSDCPVRALGTKDGVFYYLDPNNELIKKRDREHGALGLIGLFKRRHDYLLLPEDHEAVGLVELFGGFADYLPEIWPLHSQAGSLVGFNCTQVIDDLMVTARNLGEVNSKLCDFAADLKLIAGGA